MHHKSAPNSSFPSSYSNHLSPWTLEEKGGRMICFQCSLHHYLLYYLQQLKEETSPVGGFQHRFLEPRGELKGPGADTGTLCAVVCNDSKLWAAEMPIREDLMRNPEHTHLVEYHVARDKERGGSECLDRKHHWGIFSVTKSKLKTLCLYENRKCFYFVCKCRQKCLEGQELS